MSDRPEIAGFEILALLGRGGMSTVWKARQVSLDRLVAIKVLDASLASDASDVHRFAEEARAAARLRHPGIVQVFDAGLSNGCRYFVMELVDGYTVGEWLRRRQAGLGEAQALLIAGHVVGALDYAYRAFGMIHCDIKPDNIMIDADGSVKLTDLGLARIRSSGATAQEDDILGTPAYMSPEQARGDADLDCRADIYSLGASLYQIATGQMLFQGRSDDETMALQASPDGTVPDAMEFDRSLSPGFCQMLERMLAKDRAHRQKNWTAVAHDLAAVSARKPLPGGPIPKGLSTMRRCPERSRRPVHADAARFHSATAPRPPSNPAKTVLAILLVAALAGGAFFFVRKASAPPPAPPAPQPRTGLPPGPTPAAEPRPPAPDLPSADSDSPAESTRRILESRAYDLADWGLYGQAIDFLSHYRGRNAAELAEWRDGFAARLRAAMQSDTSSSGFPALRAPSPAGPPASADGPALLGELVERLVRDGVPSATGWLDSRVASDPALRRHPGLDAAATLLVRVADAPAAFPRAFAGRVGRPAYVELLPEKGTGTGATVSGTLMETGADSIVIDVPPKGDKPPELRTVAFRELAPAERVRTLGANKTPEGRLMFGLQCYHAGQFSRARDSFSGIPGEFGAALLALPGLRP